MKSGFTIKTVTVKNGTFRYRTHRLTGWLNGQRVRKQFEDRAEAEGEKARLEVQAANGEGAVRARTTRLGEQQLVEAEAAFARLGTRSLSLAVDHFLATYRAPVTDILLATAAAAFLQDREPNVRRTTLKDYRRTMRDLCAAFPRRGVHEPTNAQLHQWLTGQGFGRKRFNNVLGDLNAFFNFCAALPREWRRDNPVKPIAKFKIARGVPAITTAENAAKVMAYVETYKGGPRTKLPPGALVPFFALSMFAGLRPCVRDGEISKIARVPDVSKVVNLGLGVIQITPEISKVKSVRQVKIRPNLAEWLVRYPLKKYPLVVPNMQDLIAHVRKKFGLSDDVLRHTFISMHVGKFKSMGEAALEAGNSEAMIKKHYLNLVTEAEADAFWRITPGASELGEVIEIAAG